MDATGGRALLVTTDEDLSQHVLPLLAHSSIPSHVQGTTQPRFQLVCR